MSRSGEPQINGFVADVSAQRIEVVTAVDDARIHDTDGFMRLSATPYRPHMIGQLGFHCPV